MSESWLCIMCVCVTVSIRNIPKHACIDHTHAHIHACIHWPHSHTCMHVLTTPMHTHIHACTDHTHAHTHECMHWPLLCAHTLPTLRGWGGGGQWVCLLCCRRRLLSLPAVTAFSAVRSLHRTWLQKMGAKSSTLGSPILLVTALDHA